jgi:hypothetical protein
MGLGVRLRHPVQGGAGDEQAEQVERGRDGGLADAAVALAGLVALACIGFLGAEPNGPSGPINPSGPTGPSGLMLAGRCWLWASGWAGSSPRCSPPSWPGSLRPRSAARPGRSAPSSSWRARSASRPWPRSTPPPATPSTATPAPPSGRLRPGRHRPGHRGPARCRRRSHPLAAGPGHYIERSSR